MIVFDIKSHRFTSLNRILFSFSSEIYSEACLSICIMHWFKDHITCNMPTQCSSKAVTQTDEDTSTMQVYLGVLNSFFMVLDEHCLHCLCCLSVCLNVNFDPFSHGFYQEDIVLQPLPGCLNAWMHLTFTCPTVQVSLTSNTLFFFIF